MSNRHSEGRSSILKEFNNNTIETQSSRNSFGRSSQFDIETNDHSKSRRPTFRNISEVAAAALFEDRIKKGSSISSDIDIFPQRLRRNAANPLSDGKTLGILLKKS